MVEHAHERTISDALSDAWRAGYEKGHVDRDRGLSDHDYLSDPFAAGERPQADVDAVAESMYILSHTWPWADANPVHRDGYRRAARAALNEIRAAQAPFSDKPGHA